MNMQSQEPLQSEEDLAMAIFLASKPANANERWVEAFEVAQTPRIMRDKPHNSELAKAFC